MPGATSSGSRQSNGNASFHTPFASTPVMLRFRLSFWHLLLVAGFVSMAPVEGVQAQGPTRVMLESIGRPAVEDQAAEAATSVLTALNRAVYLGEEPVFPDAALTAAGERALRLRWNAAPFDCPEPRLRRRLSPLAGGGYVLRGIPLLVREAGGETSEREGVLLLTAEGRIDGFAFGREYTPPTPPTPEPEPTPQTGSLTIETRPSAATVVRRQAGSEGREDGADSERRTSPARFDNLPAGAHTFTIRKEAYRTVTDTVFTVQPGTRTTRVIDLVPTTGRLAVRDLPPGSTIRLNGEEQPRPTNEPIRVPTGDLAVEITAEYYEPLDTTLTVPPGQTVRFDARLPRMQVPLRVRSTPEGATVLLDEQAVGSTPLDTTLDAGRSYVLRLEREGHLPTREIDLFAAPGPPLDEVHVLTPLVTRSKVGDAQITNVRLAREGPVIRIRYDLDGEPGEEYAVDFTVFDAEGDEVSVRDGDLRGAWGKGQRPGLDKQIAWQGTVPDGGRMELAVVEPGGNRRLWYVLGGVVAAGAGTAAALLGGGDSGGPTGGEGPGGTRFPSPPPLPDN